MSSLFFFNDTATTEIYTLSLHDALPIFHHFNGRPRALPVVPPQVRLEAWRHLSHHRLGNQMELLDALVHTPGQDRKSTRLNSSHANISYAVFCLKKNKKYVGVRSISLRT